MPDWKFALERMTDAVAAMRRAQRHATHSPSANAIADRRTIEARVDEMVLESLEALKAANREETPTLTPDPMGLPPIPLPVPLVEDERPVPLPEPQPVFDIPEVPPPVVPPLIPDAPAEGESQKRGRRRGGQHGGG